MGRDITLTCNASGADNLKYQWMRMGNKTIPSTATGVNSNTLIIPSIRVDDSGQYKCVVSSGDVDVMSKYGMLSVLSELLKMYTVYCKLFEVQKFCGFVD